MNLKKIAHGDEGISIVFENKKTEIAYNHVEEVQAHKNKVITFRKDGEEYIFNGKVVLKGDVISLHGNKFLSYTIKKEHSTELYFEDEVVFSISDKDILWIIPSSKTCWMVGKRESYHLYIDGIEAEVFYIK